MDGSGFPPKYINFVVSVLLGLGKQTLAAVFNALKSTLSINFTGLFSANNWISIC